MNYVSKKVISPIKSFGGKSGMIKKIIPVMEYRPVWVEGFCSSCVITLNIETSFDERYCFDLNPHIINFWQILQREPDKMKDFLRNCDYSVENFNTAKKYIYDHRDEICNPFFHACMYFILNRMSRAADMKTFGWSDRKRRGLPEYISAYETAVASLVSVSERIQGVAYECGDYIQIMATRRLNERPDLVQLLDPPYPEETRVSKKAYGPYEMSLMCANAVNDLTSHECMLDFVKHGVAGRSYICTYPNKFYKDRLDGYHHYEWRVSNSASQQKVKPVKTEMLYVL